MRSNRPSCMAYDEEIRFESTVKIHSKLFNRSREVSELPCLAYRRQLQAVPVPSD
jgi:hypothetical protein